MEPVDFEYYGMMAQFWDLLRGDTSNWADRHFYLEVIGRYGQPVLDVGTGTGRLLLDYLALGIDVDGVDNSADMLALLGQKAAAAGLKARALRQEMQTLDMGRRYRTILVPSSSFQLLTGPGEAEAAIGRFVEHLEPGGVLVMPFYRVGFDGNGQPLEAEEGTGEVVRPQDGAVIRRWSRSEYDHALGLEHTRDRYEVIVDGVMVASEEHARRNATRDYTQEQARRLYAQAGLVDVHLTRGFSFEPAGPDEALFCVLGVRPA